MRQREATTVSVNSRSGFTLIELIFVIFILSLIVGLGIPKLNELTSVNLRSSARQLSALAKFTYNRAVMTRKVNRLVIDFAERAYWVEELVLVEKKEIKEGDLDLGRNDEEEEKKPLREFVKTSGYLAKPGQLPNGVRFAGYFDNSRGIEQTDGIAYLYFFPEGGGSGGSIFLSASETQNVTLIIHPLTGKVSNYPGKVQSPLTLNGVDYAVRAWL